MNDGGRIIMIGSCVGERVMTPGLVPYSATGAVKVFTQALSKKSEAAALPSIMSSRDRSTQI